LFSAPFIPLLMILIGKGSEALNRRQWDRLTRMAGDLLDLVQGLPDLKIFGRARHEAQLVARVSDQYRKGTMAVLRVAFLSAFTLEFFATVGTAVVAVLIGFRLLDGSLTLQDGLFVLLLAPEFYLPLRNLGLSFHSLMNGLAAAERIMPLVEQPLAEQNQPGGVLPANKTPHLCCEAVTFRYGAERGGVQDVSLTIPANGMTALVGASGSGKTTLARLLLGLAQPASGTIRVDGIDLAALDQTDWRTRLAWVPQQPFFMAASIRENLLLGVDAADDAAIRKALEQAALCRVIDKLPAGLETMLGDRGAGLSGGELRRLALARVLLRDARLVVLDEPTAGLDAANEQLVLDAVERLAMGRTVVMISHREAAIARCSRVVELANGRLQRVVSPQQYLRIAP
jgi:ATP-binding cassette subfamily C protein CydD